MYNRVYGTVLVDNDPILGNAIYQLLRSLNSGLYFVAIAKPEAAGLIERCGLTIKIILDLSDRDVLSLFRRLNISPALQFMLAHAARNSTPQAVLGNLSPNNIENLEFECGTPWTEHCKVEMAPNDLVSEKHVMMSYLQAMRQNFAVKQRQLKLEEQLSGRRMKPKTGFAVNTWIEFKDKNNRWIEARITGVKPGGYEILRPGEKKSSYVDSSTIRPT